jgi:hypothetical protein
MDLAKLTIHEVEEQSSPDSPQVFSPVRPKPGSTSIRWRSKAVQTVLRYLVLQTLIHAKNSSPVSWRKRWTSPNLTIHEVEEPSSSDSPQVFSPVRPKPGSPSIRWRSKAVQTVLR